MNKLEHLQQVLSNLRRPKLGHTFWGVLGTMAITLLITWQIHQVWLANPNQNFIAVSPDGLKNYMTTTWHIAYDTSFTHYTGMNYPFGEHTLFTDNQPLFASILQWWHQNISDLSQNVVGIINVSQVVSLMFGAAMLFLLLRLLHLPVWYAATVGMGLVFLSPQYLRFDGHFGLSHTFIIPAMLYFLALYEARESKRYQSLLIGILVWWSAQLHFYYFGMAALFLSLYIGYQSLREFNWKNLKARFFHWVMMIIVPFALLNIWIHWSDYATDRPATPYGFTSYIGYWEGVFLPYTNFPMYQWIEQHIMPIRKIDGEAHAYVGFVATAFFIGLLGWGLTRRIKKWSGKTKENTKTPLGLFRLFPEDWNEMAHHRTHQHFLRGIFTASFFLLLFACGFPFAIEGMDWMVNYMGPLRQFRGLGRFNWTFYYVLNVIAFYTIWHHSRFFPMRWRRWFFYVMAILGFYLIWNFLHHGPRRWEQVIFFLLEATAIYGFFGWLSSRYQWFENWQGTQKLRVFQNAIALVPLAILVWEAAILQDLRKPQPHPNLANRDIFDKNFKENWLKSIDSTKYQAILPLPYYHMGSENLWLDLELELFQKTQLTAFHTRLPDMGVNMSRSSVGQLTKSVQFVREPGQVPQMLNELPDNRPILILYLKEKAELVARDYPHLLKNAPVVFENEKIKLQELQLSTLRQNIREHIQNVEKEMTEVTSLIEIGKWKASRSDLKFWYQSFDSLTQTAYQFQGGGAFSGRMGDTVWLYRDPMPVGDYFISFWTKADVDMGMNHELKIIENSLGDGREIAYRHEGMRFYVKMIVDGWALYDLPFKVHEPNSQMSIFMKKNDLENTFYLDEVLIKPTDLSLYRTSQGWIVRNNFWYKN